MNIAIGLVVTLFFVALAGLFYQIGNDFIMFLSAGLAFSPVAGFVFALYS